MNVLLVTAFSALCIGFSSGLFAYHTWAKSKLVDVMQKRLESELERMPDAQALNILIASAPARQKQITKEILRYVPKEIPANCPPVVDASGVQQLNKAIRKAKNGFSESSPL